MHTMVAHWLIEKKRDGGELTEKEIRTFINAFTSGEIPDYQMSAMAMAIYFQGMTLSETVALTRTMMNSGDRVDTSAINKPKVDKHSTGGIGDKVSLVLAPLMAACGVAVPMISGRGLGITGGTLDKFESIPGYRVDLSEQEFISTLQQCGCSIIGQTQRLAPADKKLYALRDVTGTVPSVPLIVASILSKKLAAGIDSLVLDVKWGKGAFMQTQDEAAQLASTLVNVGKKLGTSMSALITDMNQPLGRTAGNALELLESIEALCGEGPEDLMEVTFALCAEMLILAGMVDNHASAFAMLTEKIERGEAIEKFKKMIELHEGNLRILDDPTLLPTAKIQQTFSAAQDGYLEKVDAEEIGRACIVLGAGRRKTSDKIDHAVGISKLMKVGDAVNVGDPLLIIHANDKSRLEQALVHVKRVFTYRRDKVLRPSLIANTNFSTSQYTRI